MHKQIKFTEVEIQSLFGHEAAEDESPERLRDYYFKQKIFDKISADVALRILVGHKGIGKSALFQVALLEDRDNGNIPIFIRPDDVIGVGAEESDFLMRIRAWKDGLREIIASKIISSVGVDDKSIIGAIKSGGGQFLSALHKGLRPLIKDRADLSGIQKSAINAFLKNGHVHVYIDDLDRGWEGRREDIVRISALLNALRDLSKENEGIRFRVALRSDVYYLVRTSDESTDKIEGSVIWHTWTNHDILVMLVKRIETFFGHEVDEDVLRKLEQRNLAGYLIPVLEDRFTGFGKWENAPMYRVLMSLIRQRPRDLVKLLTLAGRCAHDRKGRTISTPDLQAIFEEYSQGRIQDTINEFRSELANIENLLFGMKPNRNERNQKSGFIYTTDELIRKIKKISEMNSFVNAFAAPQTPKQLASFMYKINFLTARKQNDDGLIERKYFEQNRYLSSQFVDFGYDWEIHPAYRWVLQPDARTEMYNLLGLSRDD